MACILALSPNLYLVFCVLNSQFVSSELQEKLKASGLALESSTSGWCGWRECKNMSGMGALHMCVSEKERARE